MTVIPFLPVTVNQASYLPDCALLFLRNLHSRLFCFFLQSFNGLICG
ncbi:hypothetical protein EJ065_4237 [Corallococcus coralloides]|uniref:Uncharacterized protein n=1 Tax=Corallococcus coralloides TaxID=184914 RepID=A0A410RVA8_CORCK|nr:hypothetical protein EJ065_4237 [Corallococcus coralloides]